MAAIPHHEALPSPAEIESLISRLYRCLEAVAAASSLSHAVKGETNHLIFTYLAVLNSLRGKHGIERAKAADTIKDIIELCNTIDNQPSK